MPLFHLKFAVTIFIKVYPKMWGLWMHLDYDHFYIPLTSKQGKFQPKTIIFLVKKAYRCVGQDFWKKQFFPVRDLITRTNQPRKKLILPLKNTSKLWRTWPLSLPVHTFLSHLHFFKVGEVMLLKYENLMLAAGHLLDLYCIRLSNTASFCEKIIQSLISMQNTEKRDWLGVRGKIFGALFPKKSSFLPISNAAQNF